MPVYAVTGGAGFIGSHIAEALSLRGDTVRVLDKFSTGKRRNIETFESRVDVREVDLAAETGLASHLHGVDYVIHQAAIPSVPRSMKDPVRSHEANVNGTLNLLVACREAGVRRVIYASSSSLYGESEVLPKHEEMAPRPMSPYGGQKLFGEVYCQVFWRAYGLETVSLRYFNVFGPRQDASSPYSGVLARFIPAVLGGKTPSSTATVRSRGISPTYRMSSTQTSWLVGWTVSQGNRSTSPAGIGSRSTKSSAKLRP